MVAPGNDEFAGNPNAVWIIWTIYYIFIEKNSKSSHKLFDI
jgi:hypothetical protein